MKISFKKVFLVSLCSVFGASFADTPVVTHANIPNQFANLKVGTVDIQSAILQTNEGKSARERIEKELGQKRQDILSQQKQLKKMQEDLESQAALLSNEDRLAKQKEFQAKVQGFQTAQMNFEQEARQKEAQALQSIFQNMQIEIQKKSKEKSLDMVFDRSVAVLLYANNVVDLTPEVVAEYNKDYKVTEKKSQKSGKNK